MGLCVTKFHCSSFYRLLEALLAFPEFHSLCVKVIAVISDPESFSERFSTFWDLFNFAEFLEACQERDEGRFSPSVKQFFVPAAASLFSISEMPYTCSPAHWLSFLKSGMLRRRELQNILVEQGFFSQLRGYLLDPENWEDTLWGIDNWFPYFVSLDPKALVDGVDFVKGLLEVFPLQEYLQATERHWIRPQILSRWKNEEFCVLFAESTPLKSLDWTQVIKGSKFYGLRDPGKRVSRNMVEELRNALIVRIQPRERERDTKYNFSRDWVIISEGEYCPLPGVVDTREPPENEVSQ